MESGGSLSSQEFKGEILGGRTQPTREKTKSADGNSFSREAVRGKVVNRGSRFFLKRPGLKLEVYASVWEARLLGF